MKKILEKLKTLLFSGKSESSKKEEEKTTYFGTGNEDNEDNDKDEGVPPEYMVLFVVVTIVLSVFAINKNATSFYNFTKANEVNEVRYIDFLEDLKDKKVETVRLDEKKNILLVETKDRTYETDNPESENLKEELLTLGVKYEVINKADKSMVNLLMLMLRLSLIFLIIRSLKDVLANSSPKNLTTEKKSSKVKFKDVEGIDELKEDLETLVGFLKNPSKYKENGARLPKGVMLYGPPGTGKTLTAKAVAGEAGVPFYSVSGSDFVELYVGLGAKRVRNLFKEAKENAPCIVFIDEIDAVGKKRGSTNNSEMDQTINALLTELDGFDGSEGIITMAATNRIEDLDSALVRPGRFDKHIAIPLPDKTARKNILNIHMKNKKIEENVCIEELAELTTGFSGASLESLLNEAAILATNNNNGYINKQHVDDALFKVIMKGDKKKDQAGRSKEELELVAWHEAGHALLTKMLTNDKVSKVTILSSTSGAGGVTFRTPSEISLYSKDYLEGLIAVMYGGRIAEYLLLGDENLVTTGASNDIEQATNLIKGYIINYGMNEELGMINIDVLLGQAGSTKDILLDEATKLSKEVYTKALKILTENKETLEKIANDLLEKESLTDEDLNKIMLDNGVPIKSLK